jgi:hypothetical protein
MTSASQQAIVGGYLQVVPAAHSEKGVPAVNVWCDEEGKLPLALSSALLSSAVHSAWRRPRGQ